MTVFKMLSSYTLSGKKDVRLSPLSIGENRRSLAIAVVELLNLHPPRSNSGADISCIRLALSTYIFFIIYSVSTQPKGNII